MSDMFNCPASFCTFAFFSPHATLFGFLSNLLLPVIMLAVLASAMGGNGAGIAEGLADALASCSVILLDVTLRLLRTFFLGFIYVVSALGRTLLSWRMNKGVTLKTGPDPDAGPARDTGKNSPN